MMTTTQQDKPGGKPRQRSRKSEQRKQKGEQRNSPARNRQDEDQVQPMVASNDAEAVETAAAAEVETAAAAKVETAVETAAVESTAVDTMAAIETMASIEMAAVETAPVETMAAAIEMVAAAEVPLVGEVLPPVMPATGVAEPLEVVSLQTIVNAYADYARTSFLESRSFVEKFAGVRSFEKAVELQNEFARQAFAKFATESQKIYGLYGRWVRQNLKPWEITAAKLTEVRRQSW
jgi:phasin protein